MFQICFALSLIIEDRQRTVSPSCLPDILFVNMASKLFVASRPPGQMGFTFNRLGIRLPAIAISPWIPEKTVVTDTYRHTSVIRTLRERWNLGLPFTACDADAPDFSRVFTLDVPREPETWPDIVALASARFQSTRGTRSTRRSHLSRKP